MKSCKDTGWACTPSSVTKPYRPHNQVGSPLRTLSPKHVINPSDSIAAVITKLKDAERGFWYGDGNTMRVQSNLVLTESRELYGQCLRGTGDSMHHDIRLPAPVLNGHLQVRTA